MKLKARDNEYEYLKDLIYFITDDFGLLTHYLGIREIPCLINSPIRKDEKPSMSLFNVANGNSIGYKDFGTGEVGGTIALLSSYFNLSKLETLRKIKKDLKSLSILGTPLNKTICKNSKKKTYNNTTELNCKIRNWKSYDLEYWESFGISKYWLEFGDIYPISHIIILKAKTTFNVPAEKYAYAYVERKDNKISLKIYQPFSTTYKWCNKHDSSTWDLWTKLPLMGNDLIITSSRKDALCIWANTGIPACSLQAESYMPKQHVIQQLKDRFKNIYILYDNDYSKQENYGHILGKALSEEFNLIQIEIPTELHSKDSSDLYKNHGKEILIQTIKNLIQ